MHHGAEAAPGGLGLRLLLEQERQACIERVAGSLDPYAAEHLTQLPHAAAVGTRAHAEETAIGVSVYASRARQILRCTRQ